MARRITIAIYSTLILVGAWFLYDSISGPVGIAYRTMVQALIMLLLGAGGAFIGTRK